MALERFPFQATSDGPPWRLCCGERTRSIDSRPRGSATRRRYKCPVCNHRTTSFEFATESPGIVPLVLVLPEDQRNAVEALLRVMAARPVTPADFD